MMMRATAAESHDQLLLKLAGADSPVSKAMRDICVERRRAEAARVQKSVQMREGEREA